MQHQPVILYVEDDKLSRKVMKLLLRNTMGLSNFTIFEDSTDFLNRVESLNPRPDIILLDIHMHPYTGFDMLEMIRQSSLLADIPVVALTASVMNEEVAQLQTAGFDSCIAKPIDTDKFALIIELVIEGEKIWNIGV